MSEQERMMAAAVKLALPKMTDFDKGYLLAKIEEAADRAEKAEKEETRHESCRK